MLLRPLWMLISLFFIGGCLDYLGPGKLSINFNNLTARDVALNVLIESSVNSEEHAYSIPSGSSKRIGHHFECYACSGCSSAGWSGDLSWEGDCDVRIIAPSCEATIDITCEDECMITSNTELEIQPENCNSNQI